MKKFLMIVSVMMFSMTSFAQVGKTTFGAHFNYMIDSPNNAGLGANVGYEFMNNVRGVRYPVSTGWSECSWMEWRCKRFKAWPEHWCWC